MELKEMIEPLMGIQGVLFIQMSPISIFHTCKMKSWTGSLQIGDMFVF